MKKVIFIIILIILAAGGGIWYYFKKQKVTTKVAAIPVIASYTGNAQSAYNNFGDSYLIAWANAIKQGSQTFSDNSKTYLTLTGKST